MMKKAKPIHFKGPVYYTLCGYIDYTWPAKGSLEMTRDQKLVTCKMCKKALGIIDLG